MARDELDRYYSDPVVVWGLMQRLAGVGVAVEGRVLEPCAGSGSVVRVVEHAGLECVTGDFDVDAVAKHGWAHQWDFVAASQRFAEYEPDGVDWVITNPPYRVKTAGIDVNFLDFVTASLAVADRVALLLRLTFAEPCLNRIGVLDAGQSAGARMPSHCFVLPRKSYTLESGGDTSTSAWYVWGCRPDGADPTSMDTRLVWHHELDQWRRELPVDVRVHDAINPNAGRGTLSLF